MPSYHRLGTIPPKRHTQFRSPEGRLYAEEVFGTRGFSGIYSVLYHLALPARTKRIEPHGSIALETWDPGVHRLHRLRGGDLTKEGDPVTARIPILFNDEVTISLATTTQVQDCYYKNGTHDECVFVHEGAGVLATNLGEVPFRAGDYLCIPRGTVQQLRLEGGRGRLLVVEAAGPIDTPLRYRNEHGQLLEHAPYWERDFRGPERLETNAAQEEGEVRLLVKIGAELYCHYLDHHPFDVVGWDGYLYPYAFNIHDYEARTGRLHVPPTMHQVFEGPGFVICNFVPRKLEWDENAVPIPYFHSNIDSDEVIYYAGGNYGARRVQHGDLTFHPRGLPHGPSAGAMEASLNRPRETDELAVMVDTFRPLKLTIACDAIDDPDYMRSWDE